MTHTAPSFDEFDASFIAGYAERRRQSARLRAASAADHTTRLFANDAAAVWFDVEACAAAVLDSLAGHDMGDDVHAALYAALDHVDDGIHGALEQARRSSERRAAA